MSLIQRSVARTKRCVLGASRRCASINANASIVVGHTRNTMTNLNTTKAGFRIWVQSLTSATQAAEISATSS